MLGHYLVSKGYKVGIIAQPLSMEDVSRLGRPNLFFGITAGNVDSMVANYTSSKKKRNSDDYTPGEINNRRPDRAVIYYCNLVKQVFKNVKIVIGGVEASLRRFAHYDWWSDKVRKSILLDSKADILVYGMGELAALEIAQRIEAGKSLDNIRGTVYWNKSNDIYLPSFEEVSTSKELYVESYKLIQDNTDPYKDVRIIQKFDARYVVQNPPQIPLTTQELDQLYLLPFERKVHPFYEKLGKVKAIETVRFSITTVRGCYGNCSFCAIAHHQTTHVISRSEDSIIEEAKILSQLPEFKGTINDVGGPTANMYGTFCNIREEKGQCLKNCLVPSVCKVNKISQKNFIELLEKIKRLPKIKNVFVQSGLRHDLILEDEDYQYIISKLVDFTSGQLKLAPEHAHPKVLSLMRKPDFEKFLTFKKFFEESARKKGKNMYAIGYFIVGHPGEKEKENNYLKKVIRENLGYIPQQIQIFTPTPSTLSTTMYYTGIDPYTKEKVYVEKSLKKLSWFKENIQK